MSKKTILKWLCTTATICSIHAVTVNVAAEEMDTNSLPIDTTVLASDAIETTMASTETSTLPETEVQPISEATEESSEPLDSESATSEDKVQELAKEYSTDFDVYDEETMAKADWWNGNPFGAVWKPDKVAVKDGVMTLTIDKGTDASAPVEYISGELRTKEFFHYGMYTVRMKPIKNPGTVSSFFTYTGPSDKNPWDEVDIEFLGKDTTKVQFNYYTNGKGEHEYIHDLGFDASEDFHTYAFDWQKDYITWYVDGKAVYTATENIPVTPGRIMMNAWPGKGVDEWLQPFDGKTLLVASYDSFSYKATEPVKLESTPIDDTPNQVEVSEENQVQGTKSNKATEKHEVSKVSSSVVMVKEASKQSSDTLPKTGSEEPVLPLIVGFLSLMLSFILVPFRKNN